MRSIVFQRLTATNFKVYSEVSFDFTRLGPGCHAIRGKNLVQPRLGSNGAGKSTLWDALSFVLTGRTTKRLRASDVQPYGSDADPIVSLDLEIDGFPRYIERHAVPHQLMIDGKRALQEQLDQLTGIDLDLLLQTIILAQGAPLFLDLEPRSKLSLLSDVLKLDRFEAYSKVASDTVTGLKERTNKLTHRRESVAGSIAEVGRQLYQLRKRSEEWQTAQQNEIEKFRKMVLDAAEKLTEAKRIQTAAAKTLESITAEHIGARSRLMQAELERERGVKMLQKVNTLRIDYCPTCGQEVDRSFVGRMRDEAQGIIDGSGYNAANTDYERVNDEFKKVSGEAHYTSINKLSAEAFLTRAEAALDAHQASENPYRDQRHVLKDRLTELHRDERTIAKELQAVEIESANVTPWVSGFRDIRLIVLDNLLHTLSILTTGYANDLGLACDVKFAIDRQTKSGSSVAGIHCSVDAVEKFEAWSGGEAQRLRLAASLALSATLLTEAGLTINLLALDEPSAHLSPEGLDDLTTFLSEHAMAENRVVYITDQRPLKVESSVLLERNSDNVMVKL